MNYSTIIFIDLDNTLIEGPFGTAVFPVVLAELVRKTGKDAQEIRRLIVKENWERQQDPNCSAVQAMDWDDIFLAAARRLGVESLEAEAAAIVRATAKDHSRLLAGAREALSALQHPSRALVLATKGLIKYQRPVIEALELAQYFDEVLTPDSHGALKKERAFYGEWLSDSSAQPFMPTPIMVGDYYADDILPAAEFGLLTIWQNEKIDHDLFRANPFQRPQHFAYTADQPVKPTAIIKSLFELPEVIGQLEKQARHNYAALRV